MAAQPRVARDYKITFVGVEREVSEGHPKPAYVYTFQISNHLLTMRGAVVLTSSAVEIIEQGERDPIDAARTALRQVLPRLKVAFATEILLRVPIEYAECFSQNGNFDGLPGLVD
jgi:hypothetical protein